MSFQKTKKDVDWFDKCTLVSDCIDKYVSEFNDIIREFQDDSISRGKANRYKNPFLEYKEYISDRMDCKIDINNLLNITEEMLLVDLAEIYVFYADDVQKKKIRNIISRFLHEIGTKLDDPCFKERIADFDEKVSEAEVRLELESDKPRRGNKRNIFLSYFKKIFSKK